MIVKWQWHQHLRIWIAQIKNMKKFKIYYIIIFVFGNFHVLKI